MMTSNNSEEARYTLGTVRSWVRTPFGSRGDTSRPTRPRVEHGHEVARHLPPSLV